MIVTPAAPTSGEVWEFVIRGKDYAVQTAIINRLRFRVAATAPANPILLPAPEAALTALAARWRTGIRTTLTDSYVVGVYSLQRIAGFSTIPGSNKVNLHYDQRRDLTGLDPGDRGAIVGSPNANFVTAGIYWNTQIINSNTRTMCRVSPLPDAQVDGNELNPAYRVSMATAALLMVPPFVDGANNATWTPVVFSAQSLFGQTPPPAPTSYASFSNDITGAEVGQLVGSQLSRKNRSMV